MTRLRSLFFKICFYAVFIMGLWSLYGLLFTNQSPYFLHSIATKSVIVAPGKTAEILLDIEKKEACRDKLILYLQGGCNFEVLVLPITIPLGRKVITVPVPIDKKTPDNAVCLTKLIAVYECSLLDKFNPKQFQFPEILLTIKNQ